MGRRFAYVRVSTREQNTDRQTAELRQYVDNEQCIIIDKASGKELQQAELSGDYGNVSTAGDTIYIKSLDRLGRNKEAIKNELAYFKNKGVRIRCLDLPTTMIDTDNDLILDTITNILIEVYGMIAEQERRNIKQRQQEGIEQAKAHGRHLGRPRAVYPAEWDKVYTQWQNKAITAVKAMELLGLKRSTFYKLVKQHQQGRAAHE